MPDPASVKLRDPSQFRWIGKPVRRLDAYDKSTGTMRERMEDLTGGLNLNLPGLGS